MARRTAYAITGLTVVWIAVFLVRITQGDYLISLPDALRMTIGSEEANRLVVAALADFLKA